MSDFFEERKNNQHQFRQNIDKFMKCTYDYLRRM